MAGRPAPRPSPLRRKAFAAGLFSCALAAWPAAAQELNEQQLEQSGLATRTDRTWDVTLGLGAAVRPTFDGAKSDRLAPVPLVSITYRDTVFAGSEGIGLNLVHWRGLKMGPVIGYISGRDQSDDSHLNGLGDIQASATAGMFIAYDIGPFTVGGTVRQSFIHTDNGLIGQVHLTYRQPLIANKLTLAVGPVVDFADAQYDRTFFGVTAEQSARSGLAVYTPGGGVKDVGVNGGLTYRWTEHVLLRSFVNVRELVGDDADSPIVQRKTQALFGLGAAYQF